MPNSANVRFVPEADRTPGLRSCPRCWGSDEVALLALALQTSLRTQLALRRLLTAGRGMEVAMINFLGCSAQGIAVANGAITLALLEHLVERKILTRSDVRAILTSGIDCLEPVAMFGRWQRPST